MLLTFWLCAVSASTATAATLHIDTDRPLRTQSRDHPYICATMDWWPPNKCDSADGQSDCAWVDSSANTAPLHGHWLQEAVRALGHFTLRIGGTLADSVSYAVGADKDIECPAFSPELPTKARLFTGGCLSDDRWQQMKSFCSADTGCSMLFGINGMIGRECINVDPSRAPCFYADAECSSSWDASNAKALIRETAQSGYPILGWELGNELTCLSPEQFADSLFTLNGIIEEVYGEEGAAALPRPLLVATDAVSGEPSFPAEFLPLVEDFIYAYSWHSYPLGPGVDCSGYSAENNTAVDSQIMDPDGMSAFIAEASGIYSVVTNVSVPIQAWMGETGGAYDSGCNGSTNAFMSGFWYLNSLGAFAVEGHDMFCRQTFVGGNYELVNKVTNIPNPDFYSAVLFARLMGHEVLNATVLHDDSDGVRAYAHCTRNAQNGSVTILVLNYGTESVSVEPFVGVTGFRKEYILTGVSTPRSVDALHSDVVALNGKPLLPDFRTDTNIPDLLPVFADASQPLVLPPLSYGFVEYPAMRAVACFM